MKQSILMAGVLLASTAMTPAFAQADGTGTIVLGDRIAVMDGYRILGQNPNTEQYDDIAPAIIA